VAKLPYTFDATQVEPNTEFLGKLELIPAGEYHVQMDTLTELPCDQLTKMFGRDPRFISQEEQGSPLFQVEGSHA
jgi:hypothetical protein